MFDFSMGIGLKKKQQHKTSSTAGTTLTCKLCWLNILNNKTPFNDTAYQVWEMYWTYAKNKLSRLQFEKIEGKKKDQVNVCLFLVLTVQPWVNRIVNRKSPVSGALPLELKMAANDVTLPVCVCETSRTRLSMFVPVLLRDDPAIPILVRVRPDNPFNLHRVLPTTMTMTTVVTVSLALTLAPAS